MEKEFIPYTEALELKELGFDEPCLAFYWITGKFYITAEYHNYVGFHKQNQLGDYNYDSISAPTFSQAFRWFREKYDLHPSFTRYKSSSINREPTIFTHLYEIQIIDENADKIFHVGDFNSLEEAELECLKKLIEIIKEKFAQVKN